MIYFARKHDCEACALKPKCCPNVPARKIARSVREAARDKARAIAKTEAYAVSCRERNKVEMLFAHFKRILRLDRLRLRGPTGAKEEFLLAATAQNLRKLAKLIPVPEQSSPHEAGRSTSPRCRRTLPSLERGVRQRYRCETVVLDRTRGREGWRRADLMRLISAQRNQLILSSIRGADFLKNQTARAHTSRRGF
jgi:Transposase DDE domain